MHDFVHKNLWQGSRKWLCGYRDCQYSQSSGFGSQQFINWAHRSQKEAMILDYRASLIHTQEYMKACLRGGRGKAKEISIAPTKTCLAGRHQAWGEASRMLPGAQWTQAVLWWAASILPSPPSSPLFLSITSILLLSSHTKCWNQQLHGMHKVLLSPEANVGLFSGWSHM